MDRVMVAMVSIVLYSKNFSEQMRISSDTFNFVNSRFDVEEKKTSEWTECAMDIGQNECDP